MAMPESLIRDWERLTRQNQAQAQSYISLLLSQQQDPSRRTNPVRKLGALSHRFHGISDDFNAPLPEFKEYME